MLGKRKIIIVLVIAVMAGVIVLFALKTKTPPQSVSLVSSGSQSIPAEDALINWITVASDFGFSFEYPSNWSCSKTINGGVGCTDIERKKQFDATPNRESGMAYYKNDLDVEFTKQPNFNLEEYFNSGTIEKLATLQ